jgi:hypothetical protein
VLCIILVLAGHAMLGISVLLFDLVWELILLLWRLSLRAWQLVSPIVLRMLPNFIGNFITQKLLPMAADVIPIIKDDHRVVFLRLNIRRHLRRIKAWLYLRSRARRGIIRERISPLVNEKLRSKKSALLSAAARLRHAAKKESVNRSETDG